VLVAVVVIAIIGGSSSQSPAQVDLIGTGHSVRFSESKITVHDADGVCSGEHGNWWWLNETGVSQQVIPIDGNNFGETVPPNQLLGVCETVGTYAFGLQSSPGAKLVVTVDND
jgi:hypothetical protein